MRQGPTRRSVDGEGGQRVQVWNTRGSEHKAQKRLSPSNQISNELTGVTNLSSVP